MRPEKHIALLKLKKWQITDLIFNKVPYITFCMK